MLTRRNFLQWASFCLPAAAVFAETIKILKNEDSSWTLGPFIRVHEKAPVLIPRAKSVFSCPMRKEMVHWEDKDLLCAAAVVRDNSLWLLYRAEDSTGGNAGRRQQPGWGTSRIGLARTEDGVHFTRHPEPVLFPAEDSMKEYEWDGGCQDPRIAEDENGVYYMTYTAFDAKKARLAVATSTDLVHWNKHGLAFERAFDGKYKDMYSKSGSIVSRRIGGRFVATKIDGQYWMYFGETTIFIASSRNLIDWSPVEGSSGELLPVIERRPGFFDSDFCEPGGPAILGKKGILLIYNGAYEDHKREANRRHMVTATGQALLDANHPAHLRERSAHEFFRPETSWELKGQTDAVVFNESLAPFKDKWLFYYGAADSGIGLASSPMARDSAW